MNLSNIDCLLIGFYQLQVHSICSGLDLTGVYDSLECMSPLELLLTLV